MAERGGERGGFGRGFGGRGGRGGDRGRGRRRAGRRDADEEKWLSVIPVRRGYWGNKIGKVHTVPTKVTGKCGSVTVRLVPAPRGAGIVAARVPKKVLQFAGIDDVFTSSRGSTKTLGNFVKATFDCLLKTYGFLTPDFWRETRFSRSPFQEYTDLLAKPTTKAITYVEDFHLSSAANTWLIMRHHCHHLWVFTTIMRGRDDNDDGNKISAGEDGGVSGDDGGMVAGE
ncbi:hypothetical protein E3N88_17473 [Mikania micrantha]|uniref:Small ribosomal subunit protein uS5 n=1 Tax=Mikania micrantha TaxID=192012 RepID=A0A5N6NV11_9ASTR|nr:hypothetical protein E3N88_17473 [Mikania micrantha]